MKKTHTISPGSNRLRRAFSLVEVLMAVMILGIGLIMVTAVFPVGANWTRQNLEETIGSIIARNAVAIIQTKYNASDFPVATFTPGLMLPVPGMNALGKLPVTERSYRFGTGNVYPAPTVAQAQEGPYFWTAAIRRSSGPIAARQNSFDLYVFVFKKGSLDQVYPTPGPNEFGARDAAETGTPYLATTLWPPAVNSPPTSNDFIIGTQGVGMTSGTVFRFIPPATSNVPLAGTENVIFAPPGAAGTVASPLVFIYQTTVSF